MNWNELDKRYAQENHTHPPNTAMWVIICLIALMMGVCNPDAHSAEPQSAVIPFTSAEDLQARVDSVIVVRDTVEGYWFPCFLADTAVMKHANGSWTVFKSDGRIIDYDEPPDSCFNYDRNTIRHRRLVGQPQIIFDPVRVIDKISVSYWDYRTDRNTKGWEIVLIAGTAIVWWEWEDE